MASTSRTDPAYAHERPNAAGVGPPGDVVALVSRAGSASPGEAEELEPGRAEADRIVAASSRYRLAVIRQAARKRRRVPGRTDPVDGSTGGVR
ncbi:MAG: hypothetical protein ICV64_03845 [Thermoleophilia bacterium]|nr:hypothetical protein [Thermoleophilia bacterium]